MENKYTNTNTNANNAAEKNESTRKSFAERARRVFIETPMAVKYANTVINAASEESEDHCKETVGRDVPAYLRFDLMCEVVLDMLKDPDTPVDKDKFLRGVVAFMLARQIQQDIKMQTGESNKKEESND